jgi:hypothetical protein
MKNHGNRILINIERDAIPSDSKEFKKNSNERLEKRN